MTFTGIAERLPADEQAVIFLVAATLGVPATLLAAIRLAEHGGPGREFGVLSEDAPTYESQATIAARSIRNQYFRFVQEHGVWPVGPNDQVTDQYLASFGARWAPIDAANDPQGLNRFWVPNVTRVYRGSGVRP